MEGLKETLDYANATTHDPREYRRDGIVNQGTINDTGHSSINGYTVINQGAIGGSGYLYVYDNGSFSNIGTISVSGLGIDDYGSFSNGGTISVGNLNINFDSFTNTNTGMIAADVGGGSSSISSLYSFDNEGTIAVTNGDTLSLRALSLGSGTHTNNGTISVGSGSRLIFSGSLSGTGSMVIQDGGTLEVQSGALADSVNFAGVGTLQVDGPNLVTGTLSGLASGDVIDFVHAILTGAPLSTTTPSPLPSQADRPKISPSQAPSRQAISSRRRSMAWAAAK
jgi:autotransporter family porin